MKNIALLAISGAALFASVGAGSAQYYPDRPGVYFGQRYERDYDRPRYRERYRDERRGERYRGRRYNTWNGCPPMYTVQDGVCKPYTGR
jgi:hypothetical protein